MTEEAKSYSGLDIETAKSTGGGALDPEEGRIRLVQIREGDRECVYDLDYTEQGRVVDHLLNLKAPAVAHNATFERKWIKARLGLDVGPIDDTMIMSKVFYTGTPAALSRQFSHSLESTVKRELHIEMNKEEQVSDWNAPDLTEEQILYATFDALIMPRLAKTLAAKIKKADLGRVYDLELRVSHAVEAMQNYGVAMRRDKLQEVIAEAGQQSKQLRDELEREWGINPGSAKQLRERFGLDDRKDWPKTPAGAGKTDQAAMKALAEEIPEVEKWVQWKAIEKIRSTYGDSFLKKLTPAGRIHARFDPFGAATGRFSSSKPNLQNIPKRGKNARMRKLFWSGADDRVLIKADYDSIELWVAAVMWNDDYMLESIGSGVSPHVATAAGVFKVDIADVTPEQKATGKILNFALLYGGSPKRILEEYEKNDIPITMKKAEKIHSDYFKTYKGFNKARERMKDLFYGKKLTVARTAIGRRRTFGEWYGPFLNHEVQGTAADGIKFALALMHENPYPDAQAVMTVHDEVIIEAPERSANEVAKWVDECMVEGMLQGVDRRDIPAPTVDIKIDREWS